MPIGKIEAFEIGTHNWDAYCRRIKQFIMLNGIVKELHVATLVTHVGITCYELMCDLCAPALPESKSFEELEAIVKQHLEPQRSEIAERHVFRQRKQAEGESVSEYLQSLKHLAKTCNFGASLEVNLRDQFVSGLCQEDMRSRLFAERQLDYKRAVELSLALEAAERHAATAAASGSTGAGGGAPPAGGLHHIGGTAAERRLCRATTPRSAAAQEAAAASAAAPCRPCPRCGGRDGHTGAKCRFKNYFCDQCGAKGHLKAMCRKYESGRGSDDSRTTRGHFFLVDSDSDDDDRYF